MSNITITVSLEDIETVLLNAADRGWMYRRGAISNRDPERAEQIHAAVARIRTALGGEDA